MDIRKAFTVPLVTVFIFVAAYQSALASIGFSFNGGLNDISFNNFEMALRPVAGPAGTGDLTLGGAEYDIVGGALAVGDHLVQIFNGTALQIDGLAQPGAIGLTEFTGYGIQRVVSLAPKPAPSTEVDITFGAATVDPFGVFSAADLAASASLILFEDDTTSGPTANFTHQSGGVKAVGSLAHELGLAADVASATDGSFWGKFGFGVNADAASVGVLGPAFFDSTVDTALIPGSQVGTEFGDAFVGQNLLSFHIPSVTFPGVSITTGKPKTSIAGQSSFFNNQVIGSSFASEYIGFEPAVGTSNWIFASDDPFQFIATPEPMSLVVWGGLFLVAAFGHVRKRNR